MTDFLLNAWILIYTVLIALFVFGVTVFVHEFGHYLVARRCGLTVKTFSIGFGKAVFQWKKNGILYKVGWIPFGGYVALPQLDPGGMEKLQGSHGGASESEVSPWKKIAVAFSGPVGNILFAVLLAVAIWLIPGDEAGQQLRPVIGTVETNSVAYAAGLRAGDEITAVNGTSINNWYDLSVETILKAGDTVQMETADGKNATVPLAETENGPPLIEGIEPAVPCLFGAVTPGGPADQAGVEAGDIAVGFNGETITDWEHFTELVQNAEPGTETSLTVNRDGETVKLSIVPEMNEEYDRIMVGVQLGGGSFPWMLYKNPIDQLKNDALAIVRVVKALSSRDEAPQAAKNLGGPVAIFGMLMFSIKAGLLSTMGLVRLLNVNLALLNLLPIPVLDGGHILFSLWHGITGRKVNPNVQATLVNIFAILLIGAMLLITFNDIDRIVGIREALKNLF